jgi:hypothetical protein
MRVILSVSVNEHLLDMQWNAQKINYESKTIRADNLAACAVSASSGTLCTLTLCNVTKFVSMISKMSFHPIKLIEQSHLES